jgi:hypothetical protein
VGRLRALVHGKIVGYAASSVQVAATGDISVVAWRGHMRKRSKWFVVLSLTLAILLGGVALPGVASAFTIIDWLVFIEFVPTHAQPGVNRTLPFRNAYTLGMTGAPDDDDVYRVQLLDTQILEVSVRGTSGTGFTHVFLLNTGGGTVASGATDTKTNRMTFTAPADGTYDILVRNDTGGLSTMDYVVAASIYNPLGNDVSSAISKTLPFNEQDFVDAVAYPEKSDADMDDVFSVYLTAGRPFVVTLTGGTGSDHDLYLYKPGSPTVKTSYLDPTIAISSRAAGTSIEGFTYTPTVSGTYYLNVSARPWTAGRYNLTAALGPAPTSITIATNATTSKIGGIPILSGVVTPAGLVGTNIMVMVKKPGKSYYSYSSWRTVYSRYGVPSWQYKYYFKKGMTKGTYTYYAIVPASTNYVLSQSPTVSIKLK